MGKEDRLCEIRKVVIVNGKLALEGTIGDPTIVLQHSDRLAEDLIERHNCPPRVGSYHDAYPRPSIIPDSRHGLHAEPKSHLRQGFHTSLHRMLRFASSCFSVLHFSHEVTSMKHL
jgi:hypothetical protein